MIGSFRDLLLDTQEEEKVFSYVQAIKEEDLNNLDSDGKSLLVIALEMYENLWILN